MLCKKLFKFAGMTVISGKTIDFAVAPEEKSVIRLAQAGRRFDQSVEHELQIEGRAADNLENVGGGSLLLQRFAQLAEQPRVLDCDNGLGGKARQQLDLPVCKRPHLLTVDDNGAYQLIFLEHGHNDMRSRASRFDKRDDARIAIEIALVYPKIGDVQDLFGPHETVER